MKDLPPDDEIPSEDRIKARLRELTADSRRLRKELEHLINYEPDRRRSFSHDRPYRLRTDSKPPRKPR